MDSYKLFIDTLKTAILPERSIPIITVEVKEVVGETCTVMYGDLELTDVRLKSTINGSSNKLLIIPKVGSMVSVGSLSGDLKDLTVLKVDEVFKIEYEQDGLTISVDSSDKKISIKNQGVSLIDLFQGLTDLLKSFQVFTPSGPSGNPLPTTILKLTQFETKFKQLLK